MTILTAGRAQQEVNQDTYDPVVLYSWPWLVQLALFFLPGFPVGKMLTCSQRSVKTEYFPSLFTDLLPQLEAELRPPTVPQKWWLQAGLTLLQLDHPWVWTLLGQWSSGDPWAPVASGHLPFPQISWLRSLTSLQKSGQMEGFRSLHTGLCPCGGPTPFPTTPQRRKAPSKMAGFHQNELMAPLFTS